MIVQIRGWYEGDIPNSPFRARLRVLTEDAEANPYMDTNARTLLEECCWNEASLPPNFDTYTWRDLADDETVPEEERAYRYYEVTT